tara:strand:- start:1981 stop:2196 length:216 start_codon:yes stop_codon:yes gene_type:complete
MKKILFIVILIFIVSCSSQNLETQNRDLKNKLDTLQTQNQELKEKLENLETEYRLLEMSLKKLIIQYESSK